MYAVGELAVINSNAMELKLHNQWRSVVGDRESRTEVRIRNPLSLRKKDSVLSRFYFSVTSNLMKGEKGER